MSYKSPLITVYIANYNYGRYVSQSIESVLNQTCKDYELYIIDDGSNDNSIEIIKKYEKYKNVYTIYQKNKGLIASNNLALKLARGKFIIRLDADDYFSPYALSLLSSEMLKHPECALVFPDYYIVDENGEITALRQRHDFSKNVSLLNQPAHGACTMIRTDILKEIGGYDQTLTCQDGWDLWLKVINNYSVRNINLPLFYYRQHSNSLTKNEEKILYNRSVLLEKNANKTSNKELSVIAILPVRGSDIDPRSKPLEELGGCCLIDWTLGYAIKSKKLKSVIVTTPDNDLIKYLKNKYGSKINIIKRDIEMARINTPIEETAINVLNSYQEKNPKPDAVLMLYIEYPFRSEMYIDKAINTMQLYNLDVVDGVRIEDEMMYIHSGHGLEPWNKNRKLRLERNDLYRRAGGIHLVKTEILEKGLDMFSGKIGHIIIGNKASISVRSELDLQLARFIIEKEKL